MKRAFRVLGWGLALACVAAAGVVAWLDVANPFFNDRVAYVVVPLLVAIAWWRADRVVAILALLSAGVWGVTLRAPTERLPLQLVVYGVDGGTFDVIDAHADMLPNFVQLREDGTRAVLTSMEPMFSPLLWTTLASGRPPDEHGIRGFNVHSNDCRVARFWDVAEDAGKGVGLYKWLVDYPPRSFRTGGFWVPSWLAPDVQTWPEELSVVKELELSKRLRRKQVEAHRSTPQLAVALVQVGVRLSTLEKAVAWSLRERFQHPDTVTVNVEMQKLRGWIDRDVFLAQLYRTRPAVASFNYYATDGLGHLYWDRYESGGDEVLSAYRQADEILGSIRAVLGPETRLVVVSDHGFKAMDGTGLAGQFAPLTERLKARLAEQGFAGVDVTKVGHKLTVAFTDDQQRDAVRTALAGLTDAAGQPFYKVEDMATTSLAFGLTLADETITAQRLDADTVSGESIKQYVTLTDAYTGTHKENGIFYTAGPGAPAGAEIPAVPMLDIGPTLLAAMGLPASVEMSGSPVVYPEAGPRVADYDTLILTLPWLDGSGGVNEEQLKALGYIGG